MSRFTKYCGERIWGVLEENKERIRHLLGVDMIMDRFAAITDTYIPALVHHQQVFSKYKGINKGKTVVLVGSGPTLNYYKPIPGAVHIGMNNAVYRDDIEWDYFFAADYDGQDALYEKILSSKSTTKIFFGVQYNRKGALIPACFREHKNVETFWEDPYYEDIYGTRLMKHKRFVYPIDIATSPMKGYGTTYHIALQFALWTHPQKIYIVGADCAHGYAVGLNCKANKYDYRYFIRPWRVAKDFADAYYPDVDIISINPVGLKKLFRDEYTDEYKQYVAKRKEEYARKRCVKQEGKME